MSIHVNDIQLNPVKSTILLSIPIIILLFLNSLYTVIDIFWIGGLGSAAVICMGYIANFIYTLDKVGDGIGRAVNVLISNAFGAKELEKTNLYAQHGLLIILLFSFILPIITIPLIEPVCIMTNIAEYNDLIYAYTAPCLGFIIIIMMNNYFSAILGSEGDTKRATIIITVGNIINIILDPILIFYLKLGMIGAALATIIGGAISLILFDSLFTIRKETLVKINLRGMKFQSKILKEIILLAIPIILNGVILSLIGMLITYSLQLYATPIAVFTYIIMINIQTTVFTPVQGISKGLGIVTGHLAGAKRFIELRKTIKKILLIGLAISIVIALALAIFHTQIISIFSTEYLVLTELRNTLIFIIICIITFPIIMGCSYIFLGLEKSVYTLIFIIFNLVSLLALILIITYILGSSSISIFLSVALSNITEAGVMLLVLRKLLNTRIATYESESSSDNIKTA